MNAPVQGTASDMIKIAMVRVHAALRARGLRAACCCRCTTSSCSRRRRTRSPRSRRSRARSWRPRCRWRCPSWSTSRPARLGGGMSAPGSSCSSVSPGGSRRGRARCPAILRALGCDDHRRRSARARGGRAGPARAGADRGRIRPRRAPARGALDRKRLGAIVFANPERRRRLEAITHPAIRDRSCARLDELAEQGFVGIVVFDAAVMIESGNYKNMDRLVVVVTDEATQIGAAAWPRRHRRGGEPPQDRQPDAARRKGQAGRLRDRQLRRPRSHRGRRCARSTQRCCGARGAPRRPCRPADRGRASRRSASIFSATSTARAIVDLVAPTERDLVVEIGPGEGALTRFWPARRPRDGPRDRSALAARAAARLPAVEVARGRRPGWDYAALAHPPGGRVLILGNLPYSVGKPILWR